MRFMHCQDPSVDVLLTILGYCHTNSRFLSVPDVLKLSRLDSSWRKRILKSPDLFFPSLAFTDTPCCPKTDLLSSQKIASWLKLTKHCVRDLSVDGKKVKMDLGSLLSLLSARLISLCCTSFTFSKAPKYRFPRLKKLCLYKISRLEEDHLFSMMGSIEVLHMRQCILLPHKAKPAAIPNLLEFHFTSCVFPNSQKAWLTILSRSKSLETLILDDHRLFVPDVLFISKLFPKLQTLTLSIDTDSHLDNLFRTLVCLKSVNLMTKSKRLCHFPSGADRWFFGLHELFLSYLGPVLTDEKLAVISKLNPKLVILSLEGAQQVTLDGLRLLFENCREIEHLTLNFVTVASAQLFDAMAALPLKSLNMQHAVGLESHHLIRYRVD